MLESDKDGLTFGGYFYDYFLLAKIFPKSAVCSTYLSKKRSLPKLIQFFNDSFDDKNHLCFKNVKRGVIVRAIYWHGKYYPIVSAREAMLKNKFACRELETYWTNGENFPAGTNIISSLDAIIRKFFDQLYYFWDTNQIINTAGNEVTRKFTMGTMRDSAVISQRNKRMLSAKKEKLLAGEKEIIAALDLAAEKLFAQCDFFPQKILEQKIAM